jgi:hypothetical protein
MFRFHILRKKARIFSVDSAQISFSRVLHPPLHYSFASQRDGRGDKVLMLLLLPLLTLA